MKQEARKQVIEHPERMKPESFIARLGELIGKSSTSAFARKCGIAPTTMHKYLEGTLPAIDKAAQISYAANVSLDWLINGYESQHSDSDMLYIPVFDLKASAGNGLSLTSNDEITGKMGFPTNFLRQFVNLSDDIAMIQAQGDSMRKPDGSGINDGDMLLVNCSVREHRADDIYVLDINGYMVVKRLKRLLAGGYEIISDNPAYATETLTGGHVVDMRVLGHVFWHGHAI